MNVIAKNLKGWGKTLNYLLAGVIALVTSGVWAADAWIVSEDTTLTEDMTVGALTIDEGVTLDLAGYKLTCTSLDGSGTITSSEADLTTLGGTCTKVSPSQAYTKPLSPTCLMTTPRIKRTIIAVSHSEHHSQTRNCR